jgi:1-phosphofructokinase family hexose kinase
MIVTLTVNPAIDRNVTVDRLVFEDRAYILETRESAGGRGINASYVVHAFGGKTLAITTCGGKAGKRLEEFLGCCQFPVELVRVKHDIRTNMTIADRDGLAIKLNEQGASLSAGELARLERAVQSHLPGAAWLMLCGSMPPGAPAGFYARLIAAAEAAGVKTLLDTDGDGLVAGLEARPTVVAPNQQEAERLLDRALLTRAHFFEAADRIRAMGAQSVVLSLGGRGAVAALPGGRIIEALAPRVEALCPIGAGDALAAAFVWSLERKPDDYQEALQWGVAAGTASARLPGVAFANLEQTSSIFRRVEIRGGD